MSTGEKVFWALLSAGLMIGAVSVLREAAKPEEKPTPPIVYLPKARLVEE